MSTQSQHSFSSVISVNPYKDTYLSGISSFLSERTSPEYAKDQFVISYLNTQGFINSQIEISKNIPDEDLEDTITNKAYDELALDHALEYKVQFIETFNHLDGDNRHFQIFIVDPLTVSETFHMVVDKIKYVDLIIPAPLLIKSLYSKDIIQSDDTHAFIYFQENDAFITIYDQKEFLYTKSIKYSLLQMHERFCELYGEQVPYDDFINFLSKENLRETDSVYKQYIIKLYKELFANISDILTYVKRAFELEKINHIYIGSQVPIESKLYEMAEVELHIKSSDFDFDYGFESKDLYIDQLHALMHIYTTVAQDEKYESNFTLYHRPPNFTKRESGKLIMVAAASFALAFAYPIGYWIASYGLTLQIDLLQQDYDEVHVVRVARESMINTKEKEKENVLALLEKEEQAYIDKKNTLIKIHDVKVNYPMKAKIIANLTKELNKFDVKLQRVLYDEDSEIKNFKFRLVSTSDKKITQLIEHFTKSHLGEFRFSLEQILYQEKEKKYFSEVKVVVL
jgi:hypothetical protein